MTRTAIAWTAGLILLATGVPATAQNGGVAPPAPIPMRVVWSGHRRRWQTRQGRGEDRLRNTRLREPKAKFDFQVLELKVVEGLRGAKKGDVIRFGFMLPKTARDGPGPRPGVAEAVVHSTGQECLFFLSKHHDESFYIAPFDYDPIDKKQESYAKDLELTRRCVKLWEDPKAGLKAKDAKDRLLSAGMLIYHYRHYQPGKYGPETEAIPADESKLILNILADADWPTKAGPGSSLPFEMSPGWLFSQLDVTFKDGWTSPDGDNAVLYAAAKQWVKTHANTYRIQRFVPAASGKPDTKGKKD